MAIETFGLTHVALNVADIERSLAFYQAVFGVRPMYKNEGFLQVQTPGSNDIIVFEEKERTIGESGGIQHFGFRLKNPNDIEMAAQTILQAGGTIVEKGEFVPGEPYLYFKDPDGYLIEVWYELEA